MIEKNEPIDFVGEVTILAEMEKTSVTIETLTETTVVYFSRKDFEDWISQDIQLLRLVAHKIAYKLYRSSYNRGARLFYPPIFLLLDYVLKQAALMDIEKKKEIVIQKTRQELYEECGITVKTLGRTINKLKEDGVISLKKGKITMTLEQYHLARKTNSSLCELLRDNCFQTASAFPRKEASTVVTEMTAALRKEFGFHLPSIFCITFGRIKNIECPA